MVQKMEPSELAVLRREADALAQHDHLLGRFLHRLLTHVAAAHGLSDSSEVVPSAKPAEVASSAPAKGEK